MHRLQLLFLPLAATFALVAPCAAGELTGLIGTRHGICVLVGSENAAHAVRLARETELTIFAQVDESAEVDALRRTAHETGLHGTRIFVGSGQADSIPLASSLATAVVLDSSASAGDMAAAMRVLHPGGRLIQGDRVEVKPVPAGSGSWTHPYHGADNNPQSEDVLARAPYLTQFLATPWYGPMPEITLAAGGRIFKAFGHLAFKEREWPMLGKLVALNAYNGAPLWQREMEPGFMIHRNTIVATANTLFLADHKSCKLIDAATGKVRDEIVVPEGLADGPVWKWMSVRDGVIYALVGENETLYKPHRGTRRLTGWPWTTVRSTYGDFQNSWGFGRTLLAIDPQTKKVLWSHQEEQPIDSRATCMNGDAIFLYSHHGKYLAAIDWRTGKENWRAADAKVMEAIGEHDRAQNPRLGYATSAYLKCNDDALFFAGPQRRKLVAVSARDGKLLWTFDDGNVQLVLRDDGLYAMGRMISSKKFDYLTGKVLADLDCFRGNCTRATGTVDSIFARGYRHSGTLRYDLHYKQPRRLASMRPACQDGVIAANGQLYWGPWMCDCNHSLVGVISLASAGDHNFGVKATNETRLVKAASRPPARTTADARDWPTYRADNRRSGSSPVEVPPKTRIAWHHEPPGHHEPDASLRPTAPTAVGDRIFLAGADGAVMALNAGSGELEWTALTGGAVTYPPTFANGRVYVGSSDGWVYALHADNGEQVWRFRAAPHNRMIPLYGRLSSTWPVASGVMVQDGVAFAGAGIVSHDGTYVYGLHAETGELVWQNTDSGNLIGEDEVVGISVQGHMLWHDNKVYMAGGNVVSPAIYDAATGRCLNELTEKPTDSLDDHWKMQRSSRGSELFLASDQVVVAGRMLYRPDVDGPPSRYNANYLVQSSSGDAVVQGNQQVVMRIEPSAAAKAKVVWQHDKFVSTDAVTICRNSVLIAGQTAGATPESPSQPTLTALDIATGRVQWTVPLPERAITWGVAITRHGQVVVTLAGGGVACL